MSDQTTTEPQPLPTPRVELFHGTNGQHYWRAIAANGEPVADGCEGYANEADCRAGLRAAQIAIGLGVVVVMPERKRKAAKRKR